MIYNKPLVKFECMCCCCIKLIAVRDRLIFNLIYCNIIDDLCNKPLGNFTFFLLPFSSGEMKKGRVINLLLFYLMRKKNKRKCLTDANLKLNMYET